MRVFLSRLTAAAAPELGGEFLSRLTAPARWLGLPALSVWSVCCGCIRQKIRISVRPNCSPYFCPEAPQKQPLQGPARPIFEPENISVPNCGASGFLLREVGRLLVLSRAGICAPQLSGVSVSVGWLWFCPASVRILGGAGFLSGPCGFFSRTVAACRFCRVRGFPPGDLLNLGRPPCAVGFFPFVCWWVVLPNPWRGWMCCQPSELARVYMRANAYARIAPYLPHIPV